MTSALAKIFGSKKGAAPTSEDAISKLRSTEDMLEKKSAFLEKKITEEIATAKRHGTKNKRGAIQALKRKKRLEKQLTQIDGTLSTIEFQREALENANTNTEVLKNMKFAADALKNAHKQLDVDDIHDMMDDIDEQTQLAQEISDCISNPVGFGNDIDEDDLNAELDDLLNEDLEENLLTVDTSALPEVPRLEEAAAPIKAKPKAKVLAGGDDGELAALSEWAS
eukprot:TRINITY_DN19595_c0_g1_i1.p1 TRINITY_DN19595_c0_g1~~TRINITY_DN19595_c0_g1_i1.p1  ORF type:complete len:239 (+),score=83.35 TRINITY_DN19595_c0_g1_i1:46-717(+)